MNLILIKLFNYLQCSLFLIIIFKLVIFNYNQCFGQPFSSRKTAVLGFINTGDDSDDSINTVLTKSLITFLSKLPDVQIVMYEDLEKAALETGFWKLKQPDMDLAFQLAQSLGSKVMILGDYKTDRVLKKISINLYSYDVVSGELNLTRSYKGTIDTGLFDIVDLMKKNIAGLLYGKEVSIGKLSVLIKDTRNIYKIYINAKLSGEISSENIYNESFLSDDDIEISLKSFDSGKEVFRTNITLTNNENNEVIYKPSADVIIKSFIKKSDIYFNGRNKGEINPEGSINLSYIPADQSNLIELKNDNKILDSTNFIVREGETVILVFNPKMPVLSSYAKTQPLMNIVIPGYAQIQARDYGMGFIFLVIGTSGFGFSVFSEYAFSISYSKYEKSVTESDAAKFYQVSEIWRDFSITGLSVWGGTIILSIIHAYLQPTFYAFEPSLNIDTSKGNISFSLSRRF